MENPTTMYDAVTWFGRLSVHQDFFWFFSLLAWSLALIVWWRHPQRRAVWGWLPGAGGAALATALIQFGMFNPTFDFFQDRLIPGTVSSYRPALIDPYWLSDVLQGLVLAAMVAAWGWLAARRTGRAHLRWVPAGLLAIIAGLQAIDPAAGGRLLAAAAALAGLALWPLIRADRAARRRLALAALLPVFSTVGPIAVALHVGQRHGPPTPMGLVAAAFQLLLGVLVLASLLRGFWSRIPADTHSALRRDLRYFLAVSGLLLAAGLIIAIQTGRDNRLEIQQNRLRTAAAHARVFDPALLAPLSSPQFTIEWQSAQGEAPPASSPWLASGAAERAWRRLEEVVVATPFLVSARLIILRDGWLVAVLSSDRRAAPGVVEVLRRATPEDYARWEEKAPYVEESPVTEIGYAYYCRAPILSADGRMLAWLDCVRHEYYLSVERRWRAAPFLVTALGLVLLSLVLGQRQGTRERENALRAASAAAEGSRIKSAFLANVSHELRTPLQNILGYGELLQYDADPERRDAHLAALRQQGELMLRLVNDLIDLSAVEAGAFQLAPRPFAPAELVRDTVEGLRARAEAKGLTLQHAIDPGVPAWVSADAERLRQVLLNLAGNALKFTDRGGVRVALSATSAPDGRAQLVLAVSDTGPGIPPAAHDRLFSAFSRLAQTSAKEGSGLGLAVSAALCRAMGGTLRVESDGVNGSRFIATLDAAPAAAPVNAAPAASPRPAVAPRVLVVDDNPLVRELFAFGLAARGAICRCASHGAAALAEVAREKPDVVVLDLALPDGDGADFAPRLRRLASGLRLIGASAHAGRADRERALAAGMDAFLVKPVSLDALWAAVAGEAVTSVPAATFFDPPEPLREKMMEIFLRDLPDRERALAAAVQRRDWPAVRAGAHYLRNSALVIRAPGLFEACSVLEALAAEARGREVGEHWPLCMAELDSLRAEATARS
ncbi:MAG: response regulator [Verrucomicrobia bacterium]|nr:response regulator [Verrucomicrobiota bacterium]